MARTGCRGACRAGRWRMPGGPQTRRSADARVRIGRGESAPRHAHHARGAQPPCGPGLGGAPISSRCPRPSVGRRHRAPRGALEPCGGERPLPPARRSAPVEAEGSLTRGTPAKAEAALITTGRASTVRWCGSGKRDGKVYARNQRRKAPQAKTSSSNLTDRGWVATRTRLASAGRGTLWPVNVAGREATVKDCGVAVARLQGHSWAPTPLKGSRVNVGTTSSVPAITAGKTCRRSMPAKWGGGPVVVRARESRVHGEGVQCARSIDARRGVRW